VLRAQLAKSRDTIRELEARLAEKGGVSRAVAAWEPFKALLGGKGAGREAEAGKFGEGADFLRHFQFGQPDEFLHGLAGMATVLRSMEEECRTNDGGKWWPEYEYVVLRAAELDTDLPSTNVHKGKLSLTGEVVVRDKGHDGMTLADFCALPEAKEAKLSEAEVAGLRLYTGPLFSPLNWALRNRLLDEWATTIACIYSGVLKLSFISKPARVYRGVKETDLELPPHFLEVEEGKFAGGVERAL